MTTTYQIEWGAGDFVIDLCKQLGEDPRLVSRIILDIGTDDAVMVYVERHVEAGSLKLLVPDSPSVRIVSE